MAISPMYFQALSPDQANPYLYGLGKGTAIVGQQQSNLGQQLQNMLTRAQVPYAADAAHQELIKQQIANKLSQNTLNYAPQMSQAELANKQALPDLTNAQTNEAYARIPLYGAQTDLTNQQAKYLPLETLIKAQGANQQTSRFGKAYQLKQALDAMAPAARETWVAQHQDDYSNMLNDLGNKTTAQSYLTPELINKYFPGAASPQASQAPANTASFAPSTPEQNNQVRLANQMSANQKLTTPQQRNRYQAGVALENLLATPEAQNSFKTLANYSGWQGALKAQTEKVTNPSAYLQYQSAKEQFSSLVSGSLKTLEGYPSTDSAVNIVKSYFNSAQKLIKTNPEAAMKYYQQGVALLHAETGSLQRINQPLFRTNDYQNQGQAPAASGNRFQGYSEADWQHTAQKHGISVQQAKQMAGAQ